MTVSLAKCREKLLGNVKNSHLGRALERTNHFQVYFQCPGVHLLGDRQDTGLDGPRRPPFDLPDSAVLSSPAPHSKPFAGQIITALSPSRTFKGLSYWTFDF